MPWYAKKVGPFPVGVYAALGVGAIGIGLYLRKKNAQSSTRGYLPDQPTADEASTPFATGPATFFPPTFSGPPTPGPVVTQPSSGVDDRQQVVNKLLNQFQHAWGSIENYNAYARAHHTTTYADFESMSHYWYSGRSVTFNNLLGNADAQAAWYAQEQAKADAWTHRNTKPIAPASRPVGWNTPVLRPPSVIAR